MTVHERRFWSRLSGRQLGARFRRQAPIGPYVVDFACFNPRLVIEIDGGQHADQEECDGVRDRWLASQGFLVLRFWNNEVDRELDGVMERVREALGTLADPHRPSATSPTRGEGAP
jgi:very-short-patch-repair endonuclease